ncbi:hypothetical protein NQ314_003528 [Rhamnusium bicolor]|uniref:MULE transposase domain-containing protein n=1 Tax=Rhamnusium bicolor TaxID=1586634 RepID=A0AAV8ZLT1_9CUCU|nr:hypothetical protein NQ314_003528 [Rhamnusium bicolor]
MYMLETGKNFSSYTDVKNFIHQYENNTYTKFWKRDAKLISSNYTKRPIKIELQYSYLKYSCIYGGQPFRPKGKKIRDTKTFKKEDLCPAFISFFSDIKGNSLQIRKFNDKHNHERTKESFSFLPQQRQLSNDAKETAKYLLSLRADRKLVRQNLTQITGKNVILKDLFNLQRTTVKGNSLKKCIDFINEKNADATILKDDNDNFKGLFVQTPAMKDGSCQSEIVAICLLVTEDKENFEWFLNTFKSKNSSWINTKCIMTDKDLSERDVIRRLFPDANLIICIFHVMKIFCREITCEKMGITSIKRKKCLEILQQLVYSRTDKEFKNLCNILKDTGYTKVYAYFEKNWLHIKDEWSLNEEYLRGSFLNTTNNRLESINSKLKQVIRKNSSLEDFIESLFVIIHSLEIERDYKAVYQFQKRSVTTYEPASDE